uniref:Uncharacterized protein n=1 Tax=Arundo donax TaxID=35708 RepID=A0A0A9BI62_ARUDO
MSTEKFIWKLFPANSTHSVAFVNQVTHYALKWYSSNADMLKGCILDSVLC